MLVIDAGRLRVAMPWLDCCYRPQPVLREVPGNPLSETGNLGFHLKRRAQSSA